MTVPASPKQDTTLDSLKNWPYATRQLLRIPHAEIVEGHARNLFSRALNVGRLTAFVGSGASMAYGRISWMDMLYTAQQAVLKRYENNFENNSENNSKPKEAGDHLRLLHDLLSHHRLERDSGGDASSQLAVFQLSEELDKALDDALKERENGTFRETIMWITRDEKGHAEQLLKDAFLDYDVTEHQRIDVDSEKIEKTVRRFLWGREELSPKGRNFLQLDLASENEEVKKLRKNLKNELSSPSVLGNEESAEALLDDLNTFLHFPLRRYRLAASLRTLSEHQRFQVLEILEKNLESQGSKRQALVKRSRSKIIPPHRDPLFILHNDLHIHRFLTTNYDHEIERLFEDSGYHKSLNTPDPNTPMRVSKGDPIAPTFKETVFSREWTGELAALAISDQNRRRSNWVVHLHGRADHPKGHIIVTEDDYQKHYARDDKRRSFVDDAIKLAFSAQPILFVGIGMEEIDLLRPLREFVSEPTRLGDRLAVALRSSKSNACIPPITPTSPRSRPPLGNAWPKLTPLIEPL